MTETVSIFDHGENRHSRRARAFAHAAEEIRRSPEAAAQAHRLAVYDETVALSTRLAEATS